MTLLFLNGGGMRGGPLHDHLRGAPLVGPASTAPRYRFYAVDGRFPALHEVPVGGVSVAGELYDIPLATLRDSLLPSEPPELELGLIELADGAAALATVLRRESRRSASLHDISEIGDWRVYQRIAATGDGSSVART